MNAGYTRLDGFLGAATLAALRPAVDAVLAAPEVPGCDREHNRLAPLRWDDRDWWCWDHPVSLRPAAAQVALLIYLTATDERTGALRVVPGSQRGRGTGEITLRAAPGDAVVLDYRLLHGTHPNAVAARRDAVVLSFTPCWGELPADVRAHLIQHLALPGAGEAVPDDAWHVQLLPRFDGARADLPLSRAAPF